VDVTDRILRKRGPVGRTDGTPEHNRKKVTTMLCVAWFAKAAR
jgi:hypothetical protein